MWDSTHQFVIKVVVHKREKRTSIIIHDTILLQKILGKELIDLLKIMLKHMKKCTGKTYVLPYLGLVKKLLEREGLYKTDEEEELGMALDMRKVSN